MRWIALAVLLTVPGNAPGGGTAWEPLGLSGGGALFSPAISPADPKVMMIHCDMSACYLTNDGGKTWRMVPTTQLCGSTRCRPAFHPKDAKIVFSAEGRDGRTIKATRDGGATWSALATLQAELRGELALDAGNPELMFAGANDGAFRSVDGGRTWKRCEGVKGTAIAFFIDPTTPAGQRGCHVGTADGVWRSDDGGATWNEKGKGLPWRDLRGFGGGASAKEKTTAIYCTIPSKEEAGRFRGGVYRSLNRGESWEPALGKGLNLDTKAFDSWSMGPVAQYHGVLVAANKPKTVWVVNANTGIPPPHHATCYRSDDAGQTWRATFFGDPRYKPYNVEHDYFSATDGQYYQAVAACAVNPSDPEEVVRTEDGKAYVTRDGGATWQVSHVRAANGTPNKSTAWTHSGLVVTTTWNYYIDPFETNRHYICYTDIGFARSLDAGKTWIWWGDGKAPWANTTYELAFDPQTPGKIWGAFSNIHDIPNGNAIVYGHNTDGPGGVCLSTDFGSTWKAAEGGLPKAPCTSIVVDPKSPRGTRTLYAGFFSKGVFKSSDDGQTWVPKNKGLGSEKNLRVVRIVLHADGTLFALVTGRAENYKFFDDGVGLYRSTNKGESWDCITKSRLLHWPKDFNVDPKNSKTILVGAANANGAEEGGLYATADGGATWKRLAHEGPEHFGAYFHPKKAGWIYMTLTEGAPTYGLWLSRDGGATFAPLKGIPFNNAMRVAFDAKDEKVIYVTTFGGSIWRGPAE